MEFRQGGSHDATRRAELLGQFAFCGDAFARLDPALVDIPLDRGLHLIDLLARTRAHILRRRRDLDWLLAWH
jgi:hypothetical protein